MDIKKALDIANGLGGCNTTNEEYNEAVKTILKYGGVTDENRTGTDNKRY